MESSNLYTDPPNLADPPPGPRVQSYEAPPGPRVLKFTKIYENLLKFIKQNIEIYQNLSKI